MGVIASSFTKMHVEKKAALKGKVNIDTSTVLLDVKRSELNFGKNKQNVLRVEFESRTKYEPKIAEIVLTGDLLYLATPEQLDQIEKIWTKEKHLGKEAMSDVLNHLLAKCSLQALLLSKEMNLPPPIPMPKWTAKT